MRTFLRNFIRNKGKEYQYKSNQQSFEPHMSSVNTEPVSPSYKTLSFTEHKN